MGFGASVLKVLDYLLKGSIGSDVVDVIVTGSAVNLEAVLARWRASGQDGYCKKGWRPPPPRNPEG